MITHTPGPWRLMPLEDGVAYLRIRGTRLGGRYKVCNVHAALHQLETEVLVSQANAQLIAAAPELLQALIALDNYVSNNLSSDYPTGVDLNSLEFKTARKAIAKATGVSA